jgi:hypothetical protein
LRNHKGQKIKRRLAVCPFNITLTMEGGIAKLLLKVFDSEENFNGDHESGHAEFRLKQDEPLL